VNFEDLATEKGRRRHTGSESKMMFASADIVVMLGPDVALSIGSTAHVFMRGTDGEWTLSLSCCRAARSILMSIVCRLLWSDANTSLNKITSLQTETWGSGNTLSVISITVG